MEATPATTLKVKKGKTGTKKRNGGRKKKVPCEEVEDAPLQPISLSASNGEDDDNEESEDEVSKKAIPEKAVSEKESNHEAPEIEVSEKEAEAVNTEQDGDINGNTDGNEEEAVNMEQDGVSNGNTTDDVVKEKKRRGPTKMRKVAENPQEKVEVTFTDFGDHVGPGSVTLSSFLGPLVREYVPVTLPDWRKLDAVTRDTVWEQIKVYLFCILVSMKNY